MQANRRRDTGPELRLRKMLHAAGYRYRCDYRIDMGERRVRPDIVFTRARVAVFVDGCFWHSCPDHGGTPRRNLDYWIPKLTRNRQRDLDNTAALEAAGWRVVRIWEHTSMTDALAAVQAAVPSVRHLTTSRQAPLRRAVARLG